MTYDAVLVARRGLGVDEMRLIAPGFGAAVRWAVFAEKMSEGLDEQRSAARADIPPGLTGAQRIEFTASRNRLREDLKLRDAILYPVGDG